MAHRIPLGVFHLAPTTRPPPRDPAVPPSIPGYRWTPEAPPAARMVLLVHGLDEPGRIWDDTAAAAAQAGETVARLDYPNDQATARSADLLADAMKRLADAGVAELAIVAHSMGGLLARDVLTREMASLPRVTRLITVGTPFAGSAFAKMRWIAEAREQLARWADSPGFSPPGSASPPELRGQAGRDLLPGSAYLRELGARSLPRCPMTVIFGRWWPGVTSPRSFGRGLIDAFGDGVVSVASARLSGVEDHVELAGNHRTMLRRLTPKDVLRARRGLPPDSPLPPAIPVILERLGRDPRPR